MKIGIFYPESTASSSGNRITAERWAKLLGELGHQAEAGTQWNGSPLDAALCLHVFKTSVIAARLRAGGVPFAVAITGTDWYGTERTEAERLLGDASVVICLNPQTREELCERLRSRAFVLRQSAEAASAKACKEPNGPLRVMLAGHLRKEKDPLLIIEALRLLPGGIIRVDHYGAALDEALAEHANQASSGLENYHWHGEIPHAELLVKLASADLLVKTSKMEGAPAAISEAIASGTPLLVSAIPGHLGLLGGEYPGAFPAGDAQALAALLQRCAEDREFRAMLGKRVAALQPAFSPSAERKGLAALLEKFTASS